MRVYRTKGGYFYKELKNGKKTRISKEQYEKHRKKQKGKGLLFGKSQCRICRKRTANKDFAQDVSDYCGNSKSVSKLLRYVPKDVIDQNNLFSKGNRCMICKNCKQILDFTKDNLPTFEEHRTSMTCSASANNPIWHNGYKGFYVPKSACRNGTVTTQKIEYTTQSHGYTMDNTEEPGIVENNENCPVCKGSSIDQSKLKEKIKDISGYQDVTGYSNL